MSWPERAIALCFTVLLPLNVAAQSIDELLDIDLSALVEMEVVTPGRRGQTAREAAANVTVVTKEMIHRRGYRTLDEVLRDIPGFDFTIGQPAGEFPAHFLFRGIGDVGQTKVLIMVDGIIRNDVSNGWVRSVGFDFAFADVDRIEVIAGPGSSLYGANAYAGIVNVITSRPSDGRPGLTVNSSLLLSTHETVAPEAMVAYRFRNGLNLQVAGRWYKTNGDGGVGRLDPGGFFHGNFEPDSVFTSEFGNIANDRLSGGERKPLPDGFGNDIDNLFLRGRLEKEGFSMGFTIWDRDEGLGSEVTGYEYFANTSGTEFRAHHRGYSGYAAYTYDVTEKLVSTSRGYFRSDRILPETGFTYTYQYQSVSNGVDPPLPDKKKGYHGEGFVAGFEQQLNIDAGDRHKLVLGLQLEQEIKQYNGISLGPEQDSKSTIIPFTWPSELPTVQPVFFSQNAALYIQDDIPFGGDVALSGGIRFDADDEYGQVFNPRVGLVRSPDRGPGFKVIYGEAFKAPTVFEQFDEFRGNPDLEPEQASTVEGELNYRLEGKAYLRANLFFNRLKDLIVVTPNPDPTRYPIGPQSQLLDFYQNTGTADIYGFTLMGDFQLGDTVFGYANYSHTRGEDGELDNIAAHKVNLGLNALIANRFNCNVRLNWRGKTKAPESNVYFYPKSAQRIAAVGYDYVTENSPDGYVDASTVVHLTLTAKNLFTRSAIEPQLVVRNLFGEDYATVGRQSGSGARPVNSLQPQIRNPVGFIPPYHPQPGRKVLFVLRLGL